MPPPHPNSLQFCLITLTTLTLLQCCLSIDHQGQALLSWKQALNSSTDPLVSWNPSDPNPCKWFGVTCNAKLQVTSITLKSLNLQGPLPSNLQPLKSLTTLVLSSTNLTGPIPKAFGEYRQLVSVDPSDNQLSGEIPTELCKLTRLESLALNTNSFEGAIPASIGNLSGLTYLTLYDNYLSGKIPASIGKLRRLMELGREQSDILCCLSICTDRICSFEASVSVSPSSSINLNLSPAFASFQHERNVSFSVLLELIYIKSY